MSFWYGAFNIVYFVVQVLTLVVALYQFGMSIFGFRHRKEPITHQAQKRFALIIPAHNEERVVGPLIDSLVAQNYPRELFDVYLIADNCTDHTADVGERHGATVYQRTDAQERGKGFAIKWMIERLKELPREPDAIIMFDADNLVDPEFLRIMNEKLCRGHQVIQGYLGVKNPFDTWVSVSLAISYWYDNRMWQNARANLGLPCALGGTGLCIDFSLLKTLGWNATGLTEDLEFGVRCVEHGITPLWAHDAKVYDEKPMTIMASFKQRLRWQQGHFQCAKEHLMPLFKQGIAERKLMKFDTAVYLFQPMRSLVVFIMSLMMFIVSYLPVTNSLGVSPFTQIIPTNLWVVISVVLFLEMPFALLLERINWRAYVGLILAPMFLWTWGPVTCYAYLTRKNRVWYHTEHKRSMRLDQVHGR